LADTSQMTRGRGRGRGGNKPFNRANNNNSRPLIVEKDPLKGVLARYRALHPVGVRRTLLLSGAEIIEVGLSRPDGTICWSRPDVDLDLALAEAERKQEQKMLLNRVLPRLGEERAEAVGDDLSVVTPAELRLLRLSAKDWSARLRAERGPPPEEDAKVHAS
jgi:hypothetical protein